MTTVKNRFVIAAFASSLALFAAACSGGQEEAASVKTASGQSTAPLSVQAQGPLRLVAEAFADVPLRPEQRTALEALAKDAEARHAKGRDAGKAFALVLADQIEKGAIDEAALKAPADNARAAMDASRADDAAALQKLHDTLDASQREALVKALKSRMKEAFHDRHDAHADGHGNPLAEIRTELALTDDQVTKIKDAMKEQRSAQGGHGHDRGAFEAHHARGAKAMEGFVRDDFDANTLLPKADPDHATAGLDHLTSMAKTVLPVLTPEQRTKAAALLRARAADFTAH